jgi:hypothetical protein
MSTLGCYKLRPNGLPSTSCNRHNRELFDGGIPPTLVAAELFVFQAIVNGDAQAFAKSALA